MKLGAWPVDAQWRGVITQRFGENPGDYPATGGHMGVDWGVPAGSGVYAVADGEVWVADDDAYNAGFGSAIIIAHDAQPGRGASQFSLYGHLLEHYVRPGQVVKAGERIAISGGVRPDPGAGNSTGAHLHLQLRESGTRLSAVPFSSWGKVGAVDPLGLLENLTPNPFPDREGETGRVVVESATGLNLRTGPGTGFPSVKVLANGTQLEAVEKAGEWVKVGLYVHGGWVRYI